MSWPYDVSEATGGALDVLIANAGISGGRIAAGELTAEQIQAVYDVNVFGPVRMLPAYFSSKAALNMLTTQYAKAFLRYASTPVPW